MSRNQKPGNFNSWLWPLLYKVLKKVVSFRLSNEEIVEDLIRRKEKLIFVTYHRYVASLIGYYLSLKPGKDIIGFKKLVTIASDSDDGAVLRHILDKHKETIEYICRPSNKDGQGPISRRSKAAKWMLAKLDEAGVCGVMVIDERYGRRDYVLSDGPIFIAQVANSLIIPVVVKNKIEFILRKSWDRHRVPFLQGKIFFGDPIKVDNGKGHNFRLDETERVRRAIDSLARSAEKEVKGWTFQI